MSASPARDRSSLQAILSSGEDLDLSSPPPSDSEVAPSPFKRPRLDEGATASPPHPASNTGRKSSGGNGVESTTNTRPTIKLALAAPTTTTTTTRKRGRKKDENNEASTTKSARSSNHTTAPSRRKRTSKKDHAETTTTTTTRAAPKQTTLLPSRKPEIAHLVGSEIATGAAAPRRSSLEAAFGGSSQRGNHDAPPPPIREVVTVASGVTTTLSSPALTPAPPRTSGTNYDPIRSASMEATQAERDLEHRPSSAARNGVSSRPFINDASASASISSLIHAPTPGMATTTTATATAPSSAVPSHASPLPRLAGISSSSADPTSWQTTLRPMPAPTSAHMSPVPSQPLPSSGVAEGSTHDKLVNVPPTTLSSKPTGSKNNKSAETSSGASPAAGPTATSSPKPVRPREPPVVAPKGSGLLSSALFGGPASTASADASENRGPTIILDITIGPDEGRYVNFAQLVEKRYGFNALHPRQWAQHDRLAKVAAVGAALERNSATASLDEDMMSIEASEPESNGDLAGTEGSSGERGGGKATTAAPPIKRRRRAKGDEYNKDDPFIDDSEMLWQEQAAASKDGFFVYEGPLLKPGERPTIERADGTIRRPRGRGRGSRGGGGGGATRGAAGNGGNTPTSGPGSRGGTTVRKPRITKADRARMEQEKQDRERMATLAAKPSTYVG
ncbi:MAG: hypothetical protein M1823_002963 [Watsoniomyces obsoletus]|nr:MAG: hypothetical protein M1823_002963 [Watsoniomyces obsoletus]